MQPSEKCPCAPDLAREEELAVLPTRHIQERRRDVLVVKANPEAADAPAPVDATHAKGDAQILAPACTWRRWGAVGDLDPRTAAACIAMQHRGASEVHHVQAATEET